MEGRTMVMKIIKEELNEQGEGLHVCNPALSRQNQKDHSQFKKSETLPGPCWYPEPQVRPHPQTSNTPQWLPIFPQQIPFLHHHILPMTACRNTKKSG